MPKTISILLKVYTTVSLILLCSIAAASAEVWPAHTDSLVFSFQSANHPITMYSEVGGEPVYNYKLRPHGYARFDSNGRMLLTHGAFTADGTGVSFVQYFLDGADDTPDQQNTENNAYTLELYFVPNDRKKLANEANGALITFGNNSANFQVEQRGNKIVFQGRLGSREYTISDRIDTSKPHHLAISANQKQLSLYVDGKPVKKVSVTESMNLFSQWNQADLVFGSGSVAESGWNGKLEGVALYNSTLDSKQILQDFVIYQDFINRQIPVQKMRINATLLKKSHVATLEEIAPYRESLSVFEYKVNSMTEGFYLLDKIRIAHWTILDNNLTAVGKISPGDTVELVVEPFNQNPQLENINISDTLPLDFNLDLYFDTGLP